MKDYKEMADSVLKRRDQYVAQKKKRRKQYIGMTSGLGISFLVGFVGWNVYKPYSADKAAGAVMDNGSAYSLAMERSAEMTQAVCDEAVAESICEEVAECEEATGTTIEEEEKIREESSKEGVADFAGICGVERTDINETNAMKLIWGGSYLNDQGQQVILLTDNTLANQAIVYQNIPTLVEASTIFEEATFTLSYLEELQEKISAKMVLGELPFVTSSVLREDLNIMEIHVTTEDSEKLAQITKMDTLGGACSFVYHTEDDQIILDIIEKKE